MVNTKDDDSKEVPSQNASQDSAEAPPSPASAAEEAKEQMTAVVLNAFGGLKNVKVVKRVIPTEPPAEKYVNVKVIMR